MKGKKMFFTGLAIMAISLVFSIGNHAQPCYGQLKIMWMGAGTATFCIGLVQWILESEQK